MADEVGSVLDVPIPASDAPSSEPAVGGTEQDGDIVRVRLAVDQVRGHPAQRRHRERNAAEAGLRAARLSAAIEGVPLSLPTAFGSPGDPGRFGAADGPSRAEPGQPADQDGVPVPPLLIGAVRTGAALPDLLPVWRRSPLQVLARLHVLAAAGSADPDVLGRPRAETGAAALQRVGALVRAGDHPAPVLVALVHRELVTARPFAEANGVVARAAARLTMMATGLDPDGLTVPEIAYLAWFRPGASVDPRTWPVAEWRRRTASALVAGAREALVIADAAQ